MALGRRRADGAYLWGICEGQPGCAMTIAEMERRCQELKDKLNSGAITDEEFRSGMAELRFQDSQKRWWMIGAQSGKWYVFNGARWLPGEPPEIPSGVSALPETSPAVTDSLASSTSPES